MWLLMSMASANEFTCGTPHHWDRIQTVESPFLPPPPPSGDLELRNPENLPFVQTSENFAFFWGSEINVSNDRALSFLDSLEEARSIFVDDVGFSAPVGSGHFYFNVYLMSLLDPHLEIAGGYYSVDDDGFPYIVLNPSLLQAGDETRKSVVFHEFYHAMQGTTEVMSILENAWYIEASADWVEQQYVNNTCSPGTFLFRPHKSIRYFSSLNGGFEGGYVYGACILMTSLQDDGVPLDAFHRSWIDRDEMVEDWWDDYLSQQGSSFAEAFGEMAAKNANLVYSENYYPSLETVTVYSPEENQRYADVVIGSTEDWTEAPAETLPEWYGYNHIQLQEVSDFQMFFSFEGDAVGSAGSSAQWVVYVVAPNGYMQMELDDINTGEAIVEGFSMVGNAVLSVVAYSDTYVEGETFSYRYAMTPASLSSGGSSSKPFGCQNLPAHVFWALWGGCFALVWRRKRKSVSRQL